MAAKQSDSNSLDYYMCCVMLKYSEFKASEHSWAKGRTADNMGYSDDETIHKSVLSFRKWLAFKNI